MGVTLTTQQKEIYKQVQEPLRSAGAKLPESLVKEFVTWVSVSFSAVTEQDVNERHFWKRVGAVLSERTKAGDPSVKEGFMRIFLFVYDFVKESADTRDARGREKGHIASPATPRVPGFEKTNRADVDSVPDPSPSPDSAPAAQNPCFAPPNPLVQPPQDGGGIGTFPSPSQNSLLPVPAQNTPPALVSLPLPIPNPSPSSLAAIQPTVQPSAPPLAAPSPPPAPAPALLHTVPPAAATPTQAAPPLAPGSLGNGRAEAASSGTVGSGKQKPVTGTDPLFMAPVVYNARGQNPKWEPLSYDSIRELCKTKREFGERSEFFKSILKATLSSKTFVPADLKRLFSCLLPQSEFRLWERTWKRLAGDLLPEILQSSTHSTDIEDEEITLEHLVGEGDWSQAEKQAAGIPRPVLDLSRDAAERAFFNMPSKEPVISYIDLKQSVAEPFMDFVDRVRASVEKRVQNPELQDQLTLEIATTNANEACQRVILALPASPPPTLDQLIEECTRKATLMTEDSVISPRERVVASAAATPRTPGSAGPPPYQRGKVGAGGIFFLYTGRANCTFFRVSLPCYMILSFFQTSRMSISTFLLIVWFQTMAIYPCTVDAWIVPQPKKNVWVTLAQALKQDHMCLSTASAENPMSTCLVRVPSKGDEFPISLVRLQKQVNENKIPGVGKIPVQNPLILWQKWILDLPSAEGEPQELELLGSAKAEYCIQFDFSPTKEVKLYEQVKQYKVEFRADQWCTAVYKLISASTTDFRPRKLDKGMFLICGDRAYPGIPSRLIGGPCTFGHLTLASPNMTQIPIGRAKGETKITKRSASQFDEHCDAEIYHWAKSKRVAVSVFLPWVAAAKALSELGNLECWVTKQANLTSAALSNLLEDEEITRKATLQNRAAIDFLLLAHGHGCKEFDGLCCFDLSSKGQSVHSSKQENEDWFKDLFKDWDLSGWAVSLLKDIFYFLVALFLVLLAFGILKRIISKVITSKPKASAPVLIAAAVTESDWWEDDKQKDTAV